MIKNELIIKEISKNQPLFLFVTVTDVETESLLKMMEPLEGDNNIICLPIGNQTYNIGMFGIYHVIHVQCGAMGTMGRDSSILTIRESISLWNPDAIVMLGIAFGKGASKQRIGDVLISQSILNYESARVSSDTIEPRWHNVESGQILFNRFINHRVWNYCLPSGENAGKWFGTILSGEKLIDNQVFKDNLFSLYPSAIGGEMESYGMYSAASSSKISEWIMVKGICDWADGYKSKDKTENQRIAATSAVSFCHSVFSNNVFSEIPKNSNRFVGNDIEIVDVFINEDGLFPKLDIKLRNTSEKVAFISKLELHMHEYFEMQNIHIDSYQFVEPSHEYDLLLTGKPIETYELSQKINPNDVDRFRVRLACSGLEPEIPAICYFTIRFIYNGKLSLESDRFIVPVFSTAQYIGKYTAYTDNNRAKYNYENLLKINSYNAIKSKRFLDIFNSYENNKHHFINAY